jgi:hypothetical protein
MDGSLIIEDFLFIFKLLDVKENPKCEDYLGKNWR